MILPLCISAENIYYEVAIKDLFSYGLSKRLSLSLLTPSTLFTGNLFWFERFKG